MSENNSDSDSTLILAAGRGDEAAFIELYRRRQADVFRFAYAMSQSTAVAQDVTQDVFLNVLQRSGGFDPDKGSVRAWLLGCARHRLLDRLRRERRRVIGPAEAVAAEAAAAPCGGEQAVFAQQRLARLRSAISSLPAEYREALALCELAELSYAETAAVIGCPLGTVRSRLHRARALLTARLVQAEAGEAAPVLKASEACS